MGPGLRMGAFSTPTVMDDPRPVSKPSASASSAPCCRVADLPPIGFPRTLCGRHPPGPIQAAGSVRARPAFVATQTLPSGWAVMARRSRLGSPSPLANPKPSSSGSSAIAGTTSHRPASRPNGRPSVRWSARSRKRRPCQPLPNERSPRRANLRPPHDTGKRSTIRRIRDPSSTATSLHIHRASSGHSSGPWRHLRCAGRMRTRSSTRSATAPVVPASLRALVRRPHHLHRLQVGERERSSLDLAES